MSTSVLLLGASREGHALLLSQAGRLRAAGIPALGLPMDAPLEPGWLRQLGASRFELAVLFPRTPHEFAAAPEICRLVTDAGVAARVLLAVAGLPGPFKPLFDQLPSLDGIVLLDDPRTDLSVVALASGRERSLSSFPWIVTRSSDEAAAPLRAELPPLDHLPDRSAYPTFLGLRMSPLAARTGCGAGCAGCAAGSIPANAAGSAVPTLLSQVSALHQNHRVRLFVLQDPDPSGAEPGGARYWSRRWALGVMNLGVGRIGFSVKALSDDVPAWDTSALQEAGLLQVALRHPMGRGEATPTERSHVLERALAALGEGVATSVTLLQPVGAPHALTGEVLGVLERFPTVPVRLIAPGEAATTPDAARIPLGPRWRNEEEGPFHLATTLGLALATQQRFYPGALATDDLNAAVSSLTRARAWMVQSSLSLSGSSTAAGREEISAELRRSLELVQRAVDVWWRQNGGVPDQRTSHLYPLAWTSTGHEACHDGPWGADLSWLQDLESTSPTWPMGVVAGTAGAALWPTGAAAGAAGAVAGAAGAALWPTGAAAGAAGAAGWSTGAATWPMGALSWPNSVGGRLGLAAVGLVGVFGLAWLLSPSVMSAAELAFAQDRLRGSRTPTGGRGEGRGIWQGALAPLPLPPAGAPGEVPRVLGEAGDAADPPPATVMADGGWYPAVWMGDTLGASGAVPLSDRTEGGAGARPVFLEEVEGGGAAAWGAGAAAAAGVLAGVALAGAGAGAAVAMEDGTAAVKPPFISLLFPEDQPAPPAAAGDGGAAPAVMLEEGADAKPPALALEEDAKAKPPAAALEVEAKPPALELEEDGDGRPPAIALAAAAAAAVAIGVAEAAVEKPRVRPPLLAILFPEEEEAIKAAAEAQAKAPAIALEFEDASARPPQIAVEVAEDANAKPPLISILFPDDAKPAPPAVKVPRAGADARPEVRPPAAGIAVEVAEEADPRAPEVALAAAAAAVAVGVAAAGVAAAAASSPAAGAENVKPALISVMFGEEEEPPKPPTAAVAVEGGKPAAAAVEAGGAKANQPAVEAPRPAGAEVAAGGGEDARPAAASISISGGGGEPGAPSVSVEDAKAPTAAVAVAGAAAAAGGVAAAKAAGDKDAAAPTAEKATAPAQPAAKDAPGEEAAPAGAPGAPRATASDAADKPKPVTAEVNEDAVAPGAPSQPAAATGDGRGGGGAKDAGAKDAGAKDGAGAKDAGAKDAGAKDAGAKDAGAKDAGAKDAGAKDAGAKDGAGAKDAGAKDAGAKDAGAKDAGAKDGAGDKAAAAKDGAGAKDAGAKDGAGDKAAAAKDGAGAKDAGAKDGAGDKAAAAKDGAGDKAAAAKDGAGDKAAAAKDGAGDKAAAAKDGASDKAAAAKDGAGDKAAAAKDGAGDKAAAAKDGAADKAAAAKDGAGDKAAAAKDGAGEKAAAAKDAAADKAADAKDAAADKAADAKDAAADKAADAKEKEKEKDAKEKDASKLAAALGNILGNMGGDKAKDGGPKAGGAGDKAKDKADAAGAGDKAKGDGATAGGRPSKKDDGPSPAEKVKDLIDKAEQNAKDEAAGPRGRPKDGGGKAPGDKPGDKEGPGPGPKGGDKPGGGDKPKPGDKKPDGAGPGGDKPKPGDGPGAGGKPGGAKPPGPKPPGRPPRPGRPPSSPIDPGSKPKPPEKPIIEKWVPPQPPVDPGANIPPRPAPLPSLNLGSPALPTLFAKVWKANFMQKMIKVPHKFDPSIPCKFSLGDPMFEIGDLGALAVCLFKSPSPFKTHVDTALKIGKQFEQFIDICSAAVCLTWFLSSLTMQFSGIIILAGFGPITTGKMKCSPLMNEFIMLGLAIVLKFATDGKLPSPFWLKEAKALFTGLAKNYKAWADNYSNFLMLWPLGIWAMGWPLPPSPNIPVPVGLGTSPNEPKLTASQLKSAIMDADSDPGIHSDALFDAFGKTFQTFFTIWKWTNLVIVFGAGGASAPPPTGSPIFGATSMFGLILGLPVM